MGVMAHVHPSGSWSLQLPCSVMAHVKTASKLSDHDDQPSWCMGSCMS